MAWVRAGGKLQLPIGSQELRCYQNMAKRSSEKVTPKRPGRPATGRDPVLTVRLPLALRSEIESWAKQQKDKPSRSEAIRRLIEFALACKAKGQNTGDKQIPRLQRASNSRVAAKAARRKTAKASGEKR